MNLDKSREGLGLGLFVLLSLACLGLIVWLEATDSETVGIVATTISVLERMAAILVTLSLSIYALVEGTAMLYERYAKRRFQEGRQEGRQEGEEKGRQTERVERDKEWISWMQRREEALATGEPFDEPSPAEKPSKNGQ